MSSQSDTRILDSEPANDIDQCRRFAERHFHEHVQMMRRANSAVDSDGVPADDHVPDVVAVSQFQEVLEVGR